MRALLLVDGIAALGFAVAFLAVPALTLSLFGVQVDVVGTMLARLLGASLLGYAGFMLATRNGDPSTLKSMTRGQILFDIAGVAVTAHAAASGATNALMWGITGLFAILVIWRGYLGFR